MIISKNDYLERINQIIKIDLIVKYIKEKLDLYENINLLDNNNILCKDEKNELKIKMYGDRVLLNYKNYNIKSILEYIMCNDILINYKEEKSDKERSYIYIKDYNYVYDNNLNFIESVKYQNNITKYEKAPKVLKYDLYEKVEKMEDKYIRDIKAVYNNSVCEVIDIDEKQISNINNNNLFSDIHIYDKNYNKLNEKNFVYKR